VVSGAYFDHFPIAVLFATAISRFEDALCSIPTCVEKLHLSAVKLRLTRGGEAVGIYHPEALEYSLRARPEDTQEVKDTLVKIIALFDSQVLAYERNSNGASSFNNSINQPLDWQAVEAVHWMKWRCMRLDNSKFQN